MGVGDGGRCLGLLVEIGRIVVKETQGGDAHGGPVAVGTLPAKEPAGGLGVGQAVGRDQPKKGWRPLGIAPPRLALVVLPEGVAQMLLVEAAKPGQRLGQANGHGRVVGVPQFARSGDPCAQMRLVRLVKGHLADGVAQRAA